MVIFSQCLDCSNYIDNSEKGKHCCKAFPDGIPEDVFWNKIRHNENIENDNGIKFEQIDWKEYGKKQKEEEKNK